ncbi:MAG: acyl-CoA dehydrogenase family protein, partial [Alphaproteobacteria bacterium]|nr:acyl-CoA dehydrogenase family protein [Alphaproteobacteria bacterium]
MEFALTSQQRLTQESVVRTLQDCCPSERIRRLLSAGEPYAEDVAEKLRALGVPAMLVSPDFDGLGLTLLDAALVSEALGRFAAPVPFLGSCLCALALGEGGTTA